MQDKIERYSKLIPIISLLILFSSITRNYIYYQNFGININEYIGLSEFPLLFINDLTFYLFSIGFFIIYLPIIYVRTFYRNKYGAEHFTFEPTKKASKSIIVIIITSCTIIMFQKYSLEVKLLMLQTSLVIIFAGILLIIDKNLEFSKIYISIVSSIFLITFSIFKAYIDISKIENNKEDNSVYFENNSKKIFSNKIIMYLGKTNEYIFVYNKSTKYTQVFKSSEVSNFRIKNLKK